MTLKYTLIVYQPYELILNMYTLCEQFFFFLRIKDSPLKIPARVEVLVKDCLTL